MKGAFEKHQQLSLFEKEQEKHKSMMSFIANIFNFYTFCVTLLL